jgi:hypothetical protein
MCVYSPAAVVGQRAIVATTTAISTAVVVAAAALALVATGDDAALDQSPVAQILEPPWHGLVQSKNARHPHHSPFSGHLNHAQPESHGLSHTLVLRSIRKLTESLASIHSQPPGVVSSHHWRHSSAWVAVGNATGSSSMVATKGSFIL